MYHTVERTFWRRLSASSVKLKKVVPTNLKGKSVSSQHWLTRQLSDPYVEKAKMMHYRCRSAFKLIEINDRFKILQPGQVVIDCGAAPGSWTQVAINCVNSDGKQPNKPTGTVIAIDRQLVYPIDGAKIIGNMDFTTEEAQNKIKELLEGEKVNVVISDMAPNATGIGDLDNENMMTLCLSVFRFAVLMSHVNSTLLMKLWQCGEAKQLQESLAKFYKNVKFVKPDASRSDSAEIFLLAREFKGLKTS